MSSHDLFGLDPSEFVPARDRLARELKGSGNKDEAQAVKALRRPTVPAWALNQVARNAPDVIGELLASADAARSAQDEVLAGGDGDLLRDALTRRRAAMRSVVHRAREAIDASGRSADSQEREIEAALNAIVDSPALTDALHRGELTDVRVADEATGDDLTSMFAASIAVARSDKKQAKTPTTGAADARTNAKRAAARAEVDRLDAEAREAADRLADTELAVADADAGLARAQDEARAASRERDVARRAHDKAVAAFERAQQALAKLGD